MGGRIKVKHLAMFLVLLMGIYLVDYLGLWLHYYEKDFDKEFSYPLNEDIREDMERLRKGQKPVLEPINKHDYMMKTLAKHKCFNEDGQQVNNLRVVYLVKSAVNHFERRQTIRKTWGYERRFSDVNIRTVFLLGTIPEDKELEDKVDAEYKKHSDLVQGDFVDSYYNNTIKTMMGLRWAVEICPQSRFYAFFDDDYYVSTRNVLRFLRNPVHYPEYLEEDVTSYDGSEKQKFGRKLTQLVDFDLPQDVKLYAGYVFHSPPHRHKLSKWFLPLEEYPFHLLPPYVTAGGYIVSKHAIRDFYYASYFVKRFRFDDVYLGLLAKKTEIEPFHCKQFHFYNKPYSVKGYRYVVASHGYPNPSILEKVWNQQKEAGNA